MTTELRKRKLAKVFIVIATLAVLCVSSWYGYKTWYKHRLVNACYSRWSKNTFYRPSKSEVKAVVEYIILRDRARRDPVFYCGVIDWESTGNTTARPKMDSHKTYGLGCILVGTARDTLARNDERPPKYLERALYNPFFNVRIMIWHLEHLSAKCSDDKWVLRFYNAGVAGTGKVMVEGKAIDFSYYDKVQGSIEALRKLVWGSWYRGPKIKKEGKEK